MSDSDWELIHAYARAHDAEAFSRLVEMHEGFVYGTCVRILGDTAAAEDVAQDCFFQLARNVLNSLQRSGLHTSSTPKMQPP